MRLDTSIARNYRITIQNNAYRVNDYYSTLRMGDTIRAAEELNTSWYGSGLYEQIMPTMHTTANNYIVCNDYYSLYANTSLVNPTYTYGTLWYER